MKQNKNKLLSFNRRNKNCKHINFPLLTLCYCPEIKSIKLRKERDGGDRRKGRGSVGGKGKEGQAETDSGRAR